MILENTVTNISKDFEIVKVVDVSDYNTMGKKWLYEQIKSGYQSSYSPNQRLVFVYQGNDVYKYKDLPSEFSTIFQNLIFKIDISNYFVIVISNNNDRQREFDSLQPSTTCPESIQHVYLPRESYTSHRQYQTEAICIRPWSHAYFDTNGDVLPCCIAKASVGNLKNSSLNQIINNTAYQTLRQNMLDGVRDSTCAVCYENEDQGIESSRTIVNRSKLNELDQIINNRTITISAEDIISMELSFDNTCNFKCRSCDSRFSSMIAQEEKKIFKIDSKLDLLTRNEKNHVWQDLQPYFNHLVSVKFTGGEPLLTDHHYKILQYLIDNNKTDIKLNYISNLSMLTYKNHSILDLWKKFTRIDLTVSLDGEGARAEYIRKGTVWPQILNNLNAVSKCNNIQLSFNNTVSLLSVFSLIDLQQYLIESNDIVSTQFRLNILQTPNYLSLQVLPKKFKEQVEKRILQHMNFLNKIEQPALAHAWQSVLNYMMSQDMSHLLPEFFATTNRLDLHRGDNFASTFEEYKELIHDTH